jgi:hypothetical protein
MTETYLVCETLRWEEFKMTGNVQGDIPVRLHLLHHFIFCVYSLITAKVKFAGDVQKVPKIPVFFKKNSFSNL